MYKCLDKQNICAYICVIAKTIAKSIATKSTGKDKNLSMNINSTKKSKPQKVRMKPEELAKLREFAETFLTKQACCDHLKIKRTITLDLLLLRGYASPDTIKNVRSGMRRKQAA